MALRSVFMLRRVLETEVSNLLRLTATGTSHQSIPILKFSVFHPADSDRPKQPINAFVIFMQEQRLAIQPDDNREFMRAAGTRWRELSDAEKQPYREKQLQLQEKYKEELASYKSLLSKEDKLEQLNIFRENRKKRQKRIYKKVVRATDPPKMNRSAFSFYLSSRFSAIPVHSLRDAAELVKDSANSWKTLFSHQKQPFIDQALQDKERYQQEMDMYARRLKEEGKFHLLPVKYQKRMVAQEKRKQRAKKG
uniref:Mitochondrial transcription factor a n=1 Tax=Polyandrocarpa misakiensis TaxID=7723 RepID=X5I0N1_POLMI|nr:mitochondrial transcription factor a [Polyandrocarpa misakiensis]